MENSPNKVFSKNTLDFDKESYRKLGYQFVDLMADILEQEHIDPVLAKVEGETLQKQIQETLPRQGLSQEKLLQSIRDRIWLGQQKNGHPRFLGYVCSSAAPIGALADALSSILNQNVTSWQSAPGATEIERLVLRWLATWVGFSKNGHGFFVSGGSAANFTAIACALAKSTQNSGTTPLTKQTIYCTKEGHLSLEKACRTLGISQSQIRMIPVDKNYRMVAEKLQETIKEDRKNGWIPSCVCASIGTTNTGAIDPIEQLVDICQSQKVWLHIDGAYGAPAAVTKQYQWLQNGLSKADSLALDPHKWLFAPLDIGCILFRNETDTRSAFSLHSEYTTIYRKEPIEKFAFYDHSLEMSRRARALKLWVILKMHGTDTLTGVIENNIRLRQYLDKKIEQEKSLELLGSELSISCFRWKPKGVTEEEILNRYNQKILATLVEEGKFFLSPTKLEGRFALRICIVNFRTTKSDMDLLLSEILRIGTSLK